MSLKEFLKEQKAERKQMREEMKKSKKQPKTKREKVYKALGIIFGILVAVFAILYAFRDVGRGYDWNKIAGLTDEMKTKLSEPINESEIFGSNQKLNESDLTACKAKLLEYGIDIEQIEGSESITPSGSFVLSSRELGALAIYILNDLQSENSFDVQFVQIYNIGETFYEKIITKIDLSKLISNSNLPSIFVTTESRFEVQNKELVALTFKSQINNFNEEESEEILEVLNKTFLTMKIERLGISNFNIAINLFNTLINTKMILYSDSIQFVL